MLKCRSFQVQSVNGTLNCRYYSSASVPVRKNVIICHGFGVSMANNFKFVNPLVRIRFGVILFNFVPYLNNSTGNTSVLTEKQNLLDVIKQVKESFQLKILDLFGCSQGGLVAALAANDLPHLVNKLALFYPAFCIPDDARHHRYTNLNGVRLAPKYLRDARRLDPWQQIRNYRRPVLICHGNCDSLVNIGYAEKAHSTYKNSKLVTIKHGDHGFKHAGFRPALTALLKFLKF